MLSIVPRFNRQNCFLGFTAYCKCIYYTLKADSIVLFLEFSERLCPSIFLGVLQRYIKSHYPTFHPISVFDWFREVRLKTPWRLDKDESLMPRNHLIILIMALIVLIQLFNSFHVFIYFR